MRLPVCFHGRRDHPEKGPTLKIKTLLPEQQILYFKRWPSLKRERRMKMTELLSLKVYILTVRYFLARHFLSTKQSLFYI